MEIMPGLKRDWLFKLLDGFKNDRKVTQKWLFSLSFQKKNWVSTTQWWKFQFHVIQILAINVQFGLIGNTYLDKQGIHTLFPLLNYLCTSYFSALLRFHIIQHFCFYIFFLAIRKETHKFCYQTHMSIPLKYMFLIIGYSFVVNSLSN